MTRESDVVMETMSKNPITRRLSDGVVFESSHRPQHEDVSPLRVSINLPPVVVNDNRDNSEAIRRSMQDSNDNEERSDPNPPTSVLRRLSSNLGGISSRRTSRMTEDEEALATTTEDNDMRSPSMKRIHRRVLCLRIAVLLTLVAATTAVATVTYIYVSRDEEDDFKTEYDSAVVKVAEGFQNGVNTKVWSAQAFSAMYTSRYGDDPYGNRTWPNATMPDFQQQAAGQLLLSDGRALSFNPIINNETRDEWEAHATESAWILGAEELVTRQCDTCRIVADGIYRKRDGENVDDPGFSPDSAMYPYTLVPVWQIAPIVTNERAVMFNLHSETNRQRALDDMLTYKVPVLTAILQLVQDTETRPSSILFYPVVASFSNTTGADEVVGSISIVFSWDTVLDRILPDSLRGVVCVLTTNTGQEYTFLLEGESVRFLGEGDLHDDDYNDMEYLVNANIEGTSKELGIVDNLITYQLRCYPSKEFEDQYKTNWPAIYTVAAVLIFLFTAALFLLYDYLVEHRQSQVAKAAEQTGRIVNSMYPAAFRDRLIRQQQDVRRPSLSSAAVESKSRHAPSEGAPLTTQQAKAKGTDRHKIIKKFLKVSGASKPDYNVGANLGSTYAEDPIADWYPESSIMVCDLVGFTAWSAEQSPNDVFSLLETLYWEFDQLAHQSGVFKLGTIGDSYIAVTGLPDPMEKHASAMAEFAIQCRKKVEEVRRSLAYTNLNWDDLNMRFGIHSGPVTAGILRGQKSRFELFGDTINTASRMESTSKPNCIQVSQETASLLRMEGMGNWLAPRKKPVPVKGKGMLSTFWLIPPDEDDDDGWKVPDELIACEKLAEQTQEATQKRSSIVVPMDVQDLFDESSSSESQKYDDDMQPLTTPNGGGENTRGQELKTQLVENPPTSADVVHDVEAGV